MDQDKFPISFWEYEGIKGFPLSGVDDWHDAGMTVAMSPSFSMDAPEDVQKIRTILDMCRDRGMKAILWTSPGAPANPSAPWEEIYREWIAKMLRAFGDHPAVYGPHLGDEPNKEHFHHACTAMRIWREMAPQWSPYLNLLPWHFTLHDTVGYDRWPVYLDDYCTHAQPPFIAYDCYYQMNPGMMGEEIYFTNLKYYSEAAQRNNTWFWTTLMCTPHYDYRELSEAEFRWQLNTALAWGAKGISWFVFSQRGGSYQNYRYAPINNLGKRSESFAWLSNVNSIFLNTKAPVLKQLRFKKAYNAHINFAWGGFPVCEPDWRVKCVTSDTPMIVSEFTHPDGSDYVALTNMSRDRNTHPTFAVAGRRPMLLSVGWNGAEVRVDHPGGGASGASVRGRSDDYIAVHQYFAAGQMELYRVVDEGQK